MKRYKVNFVLSVLVCWYDLLSLALFSREQLYRLLHHTMNGDGGETAGLLAELSTVFQRVEDNKFLYLPNKLLVPEAQAAVRAFSEHIDVYFKFLARWKPKV